MGRCGALLILIASVAGCGLLPAVGEREATLIVHSEGDLRCPIEQAEQLFTTLKWRWRRCRGLDRRGPAHPPSGAA